MHKTSYNIYLAVFQYQESIQDSNLRHVWQQFNSSAFWIRGQIAYFECEKKQKMSQYEGVYFQTQNGNWYARLLLNGTYKHGGTFNNEMDAAKRVNQLCEEMRIPLRNPEISAIPINQQCVIHNFVFCPKIF